MKALTVKLLEPTNIDTLRALSRGLGRFILAASVLVVLFAGTFPFDFKFQLAHSTPFDWRLNQYDPYFGDRGQNILFFIPFGFGFAAIIRTQLNRAQWRMGVAPLASLLLSGFIEALQKFVSFRDPSLMDLWANTVGGTVGAAIYVQFGDRMLAAMARGLVRMQPLAKPQLIGGLTIAYALFHLGAPLLLHDPGDLSVWDPTLPLVIGNEVGGDRPWSGEVREIFLADRAVNESEVRRLSSGEPPETVIGESLLGDYRLAGQGPYPDQTGQLPPLKWATTPATLPADGVPRISAEHWLSTEEPITLANQRIMKSSQLTFAASFITPDTGQRGPARLASISGGTSSRNIQIAQELSDVVVRVRNAVRSAPDLHIQDILVPGELRHVIVTTHAAESVIYVDGRERGRIHITPEAKVIWRLYPRAFRLRLEEYGFRSYAAIYRAIIFIPLAALLGATLLLTKLTRAQKWVLAGGWIFAMGLLVEAVLITLGGQFEPINPAISMIIGFGTLGGLNLWRRIRDVQESAG